MVETDNDTTQQDAEFIKNWVSANSEKFFNESIKLNLIKRILDEKFGNEKLDTILKEVENRFEKMKMKKKSE